MTSQYDLVVVGGGFYGLRVALHAREELGFKSVAVLEREPEVMARASYVNQARVHNGYHYPRSILTAYRSRVNFPVFAEEYSEAIVDNFDHYYAVARRMSKISARQFEIFCDRIGASWKPAPEAITDLFSPLMVDGVYRVEEPAFDSRVLRDLVLERIDAVGGIDIRTDTQVEVIASRPGSGILVKTSQRDYFARKVISAVYSGINVLHRASGLPQLPLQHEIAEMALVRLPEELSRLAFTVLDGPFFSMMPFPSLGLHTLSHVRYTPQLRWHESGNDNVNPYERLASSTLESRFRHMYADVVRYMPPMSRMTAEGSIAEVKTVLSRSEANDSRPILFSTDHGLASYTCIMGAKIDNIYDVLGELTSNG